MVLNKHLITYIITFAIWFIFLLTGLLSDYYQTWSFSAQLWLCAFAFFLLLPLTYIVLRQIWKEEYLMIEVRPEGYIDGLCSDITLNRQDMRSKFGYIALGAIALLDFFVLLFLPSMARKGNILC